MNTETLNLLIEKLHQIAGDQSSATIDGDSHTVRTLGFNLNVVVSWIEFTDYLRELMNPDHEVNILFDRIVTPGISGNWSIEFTWD